MIAMTYFAFTSLSTVGLGDIYPRSNIERLAGATFLLVGVMITSFIIESLNQMLSKVQRINESFEETDKLSLFFGTLKKFNFEKPFPKEFVENIESYFEHRWEGNRSNAISNDEDRALME